MKLTRLPALCPWLTLSLHSRLLPAITSTYTYPASPGVAPTVDTTTPIPAVTATPISILSGCQSDGSLGAGPTSGGLSAASVPGAPSAPVTTSSSVGNSSSSSQTCFSTAGSGFILASSGASSAYWKPEKPSIRSNSTTVSSGLSSVSSH